MTPFAAAVLAPSVALSPDCGRHRRGNLDRAGTAVADDRQRHRFSGTNLFEHARKLGDVLDRLAVRGSDNILDLAVGCHAPKARFLGR